MDDWIFIVVVRGVVIVVFVDRIFINVVIEGIVKFGCGILFVGDSFGVEVVIFVWLKGSCFEFIIVCNVWLDVVVEILFWFVEGCKLLDE